MDRPKDSIDIVSKELVCNLGITKCNELFVHYKWFMLYDNHYLVSVCVFECVCVCSSGKPYAMGKKMSPQRLQYLKSLPL